MTHPDPVQATPSQPFIDDSDFTLHVGDAIDVLRSLPDESVHCVVTSPPYFGLRDYQTGTWAGGDPDCDHTMPARVDPVKATATSTLIGSTDSQGHLQEPSYRDICGKCGATRTDQQLGLEPTPEAYVARMVEVFREVRRVMRRDATLWLNLGDSFTDKQLQGIPWRLAFALQADGWYLRSEIIWAKPNPMPESVTDRPTKSHEQVFLLTRSPRYFYDADAIREPARDWGQRSREKGKWYGDNDDKPYKPGGMKDADFAARGRNSRSVWTLSGTSPTSSREAAEQACGVDSVEAYGRVKTFYTKFGQALERAFAEAVNGRQGVPPEPDVITTLGAWEFATQANTKNSAGAAAASYKVGIGHVVQVLGKPRNGSISGEEFLALHEVPDVREAYQACLDRAYHEALDPDSGTQLHFDADLWEIATQPYAEAHFATFPEELPRRCIAAGTSEHGCCPVCEAPWERIVEVESSWRSRAENGAIRGNLAPEGLVGAGTQRAVHGSGVSHDLDSRSRKELGWRPTCGCGEWAEEFARHSLPPIPCTVLDPFMGSGTVALVARKLGRRSIGIELNPEYAELAARRLQQLSLLA